MYCRVLVSDSGLMYNLAQLLVILLIYIHSPLMTMASPTRDNVHNVQDRRDQVPISVTPDQRVQSAGTMDKAVNRIVQEEADRVLLDAHQGISEDKDGKNEQRGIVFANSHNDEMQKEPFTLAYDLGLASMEADTWLVPPSWFDHGKPSSRPTPESPSLDKVQEDGLEEPQLYVGHTPIDLRREGTLKGVYLDRIWDILERLNEGKGPGSSSSSASGSGSGSRSAQEDEGRGNKRGVVGEKSWDWNGVFTDRGVKDQTLLFYIDVKHNPKAGEIMWPYLVKALQPFRDRGYLTTFHRESTTSPITQGDMRIGPLTIIGTGDTPLLRVLEMEPRDIFFDAPLIGLERPIVYTDPTTGDLEMLNWSPTFAPVASGKFPLQAYVAEAAGTVLPFLHDIPYPTAALNPGNVMSSVAARIKLAHSKGIEARWWGVVSWPRRVRWRMWRRLKALGADWINADELVEVAQFLRGEREKRGVEEQEGDKKE